MAWIFGMLRLTSIPDTETNFLCHQVGNFLSDVKKVKQVGIQKVNRSRTRRTPRTLTDLWISRSRGNVGAKDTYDASRTFYSQ